MASNVVNVNLAKRRIMAHIANSDLADVYVLVCRWNKDRVRAHGVNAQICDAFDNKGELKLKPGWRIWWTSGEAGEILRTMPPKDPEVGAPDKRTGARSARWRLCVNGCKKPVHYPSFVLCEDCFAKLDEKMRNLGKG